MKTPTRQFEIYWYDAEHTCIGHQRVQAQSKSHTEKIARKLKRWKVCPEHTAYASVADLDEVVRFLVP